MVARIVSVGKDTKAAKLNDIKVPYNTGRTSDTDTPGAHPRVPGHHVFAQLHTCRRTAGRHVL